MSQLIQELPEDSIAVNDIAFLGLIKRYGTQMASLFQASIVPGVGECWVGNYPVIFGKISEHTLTIGPEY